MTATSFRIAAFADRRPKLLALALGAISATGFAPLNFWPLTLLAFGCWMALVARSPKGWRAFGIGWTFGVGHFVVGLNWIATAFTYQAAMPAWLGWIAVVLLALYLAVYPALAAWGAWMVRSWGEPATRLTAPSYILAFSGLWTLTEWLRSWVFTGFAWNPLGAVAISFAQPAQWIGTYGLSGLVFIVAAIYVLPYFQRSTTDEAPRDLSERRQLLTQLGFGAVIAAFMALVYFDPFPSTERLTAAGTTPITVVQPNVGQQDKWRGEKADANFAKLARLTVPRDDAPRLILWPEAAIPDYLETGYPAPYYDRSPMAARARLTALMNPGDLMLLGALKLELDRTGEARGARNAVMTVHPDGTLGARYDKAHLVPYGEYLPMRPILSALGLSRLVAGSIDYLPGPGPLTIDLGEHGKAGVMICYEIVFSGAVADKANRPDYIFNPSNDGWFGWWGPPQHLAQARMRAIEEGLPVLRSTTTGISAVIDADGVVVDSIASGKADVIEGIVPAAKLPTLFSQWGHALTLAWAALLLALGLLLPRVLALVSARG